MSDPVQTDALAAEYVLGTLDFDERTQAQALLVIDPEFVAKVRLWERWLGELHLMVEPVEPEGKVWDRIKAKMPAAPPKAESRIPGPRVQEPASAPAAAQVPGPDAVPAAATEPTPAVTPGAAPAQFAGLPAAPNLPPTSLTPASLAPASLAPTSLAPTSPMPIPEPSSEPSSEPSPIPGPVSSPESGQAPSPATKPEPDALPGPPASQPESLPESPLPSPALSPPPSHSAGPASAAAAVLTPSMPLAAPVEREDRTPASRRRHSGWRMLAMLMTLVVIALAGLLAAWRFAPEHVPPMLKPVELMRAVGVTVSPGPPARRPAPPESQFEE